MKTMLAGAIALAALVAPAHADVQYDRKLEAAIKAKVAETIGEIRGTFGHGDSAVFVQPDPLVTGAVASPLSRTGFQPPAAGRRGALTLAVDRKRARHIF